jgi:hypothetical protein
MSTSSAPSNGTGETVTGGTPQNGEPQETERLREDIAKETTDSPQVVPVARWAGTAVAAVAAGITLAWLWRRRARRNANPWQRAARTAKSQIKSVRGEAKTQATAARRQVKQQVKQQVATAKSKAKAAKIKAKTLR